MMTRDELATLAAVAFGGFLALVLRDRIEYHRWLTDWTRTMNSRFDNLKRRAVMLAEEGIPDGT